jgi:PAS domain S-box-containing protein
MSTPQRTFWELELKEGLKPSEISFSAYVGAVPEEILGLIGWVSLGRLDLPATANRITKKRSMTEQLQYQNTIGEERLRLKADHERDVFWLADSTISKLYYVTPSYEKVWGQSLDILYANPSSRLEAIVPHDRPRVLSAIQKAGINDYNEEYRILRPDGSTRWIWDRAFSIRNRNGVIDQVAGIAEDVTERKHLEEELRQAQKMEAVGRLAGGIAHDFNNLLTVITGYSELLLTRPNLAESDRDMIQQIKKSGERAASMTRQLLAFSRRQMLVPEILDLNSLINSLGEMLRRIIGEDIELELQLDSQLGSVTADPGQIQQVLMNLVVNARDAMPQGGNLSIHTGNVEWSDDLRQRHPDAKPGPYALMTVADTGIGISPSVQEHLFEPFFTTKGVGKGTGLGLSTVYGIVKQSNGLIEVESSPGHGASFKIYLPLGQSLPKRRSREKNVIQPAPAHQTILVVEDEELVRSMTRTLLQGAGYTVLVGKDGLDAMEISKNHKGLIHLLLSDVVMPRMNGQTLYQKMSAERPDMKVLFTSGYSDSALFRHGMADSPVTILLKPYTQEALLTHVRETLAQE